MARNVLLLLVTCLMLGGCTALLGGGKKKPRSAHLETGPNNTHITDEGIAAPAFEEHTGSTNGR
ncbi:MAG: hypothetical protein AAAFM81_05130 [Pseudomonadota bacterium]